MNILGARYSAVSLFSIKNTTSWLLVWSFLSILSTVCLTLGLMFGSSPEPIEKISGSPTAVGYDGQSVQNLLTGGEFVTNAPDGEAFVEIAFAKPTHLSSITHRYPSKVDAPYRVESAAAEWSDDEKNWIEASRGSNADGTIILPTSGSGKHRFWRMTVLRSGKDKLITIGELRFAQRVSVVCYLAFGWIICLSILCISIISSLFTRRFILPVSQTLRIIFFFTMATVVTSLCLLIAFIRSDWYARLSSYNYDALVDQRMRLSGRKDEVLIIGDSSALLGVRPLIVEQYLPSISVYNLSLYAVSGVASLQVMLDRYLAQNSPPRLVIYHITASNPAYNAWQSSYERASVVLRYGSLSQIVEDLWEHPGDMTAFLKHIPSYVTDLPATLRVPVYPKHFEGYSELKGAAPSFTGVLGADCSLSTFAITSDTKYLRYLKEHLQRMNIPMIIYVAPMPACDSSFSYYQSFYRSVTAYGPESLPSSYFSDYTHMTDAGSEFHAKEIAVAIKQILRLQN